MRDFGAQLSQQGQLGTGEALAWQREHPEVEAILTSSHVRFGAEAIAALPLQIKVLATCSVGIDHIDVAAASARGLVVLTQATADLTIMLMPCACRQSN